jgi:hypothetical protein
LSNVPRYSGNCSPARGGFPISTTLRTDRLTEKQIKHYNAILTDPDPMRRYEQMDTQKQIFEVFPPFWYYKGNAAKEVANRDLARDPFTITSGYLTY